MKPAPGRILMQPAWKTPNRYTALLSDALQDLGAEVTEFAPSTARDRFDVVHVHWPESPLGSRTYRAAIWGLFRRLRALAIARRRGAVLIWTAHNIRTHDQRRPWLESIFWRVFLPRVDGWIALSAASHDAVLAARPRLASLPSGVVRHGHYVGSYPDQVSRRAARADLSLPADAAVVLSVGRVRPYKNLEVLVDTVRRLPDDRLRLVVAGACPSPELADTLRRAAGDDPRIVLHLNAVPDDRLQHYFRSADLAVIPFRDVLNSGSTMLALSFDCPILVPAIGSLPELSEEVGADWVRTFEGDLDTAALETALRRPRPTVAPHLRPYSWPTLATQTLELYGAAQRHRGALPRSGERTS